MNEVEARPGVLRWIAIIVGCGVMGVAVAGAVREIARPELVSWTTWLVGAALFHDFLLIPLVLLVGLGIGRLPATWRVPARSALYVSAVVALVSAPVVWRFGARPDNPTLLPLPAGRNVALVLTTIALATAVWVAMATAAARRRRGQP